MPNSPAYDKTENPSYVWGGSSLNPQTKADEYITPAKMIADAIDRQGENIANAINNVEIIGGGDYDSLTQEDIEDILNSAWGNNNSNGNNGSGNDDIGDPNDILDDIWGDNNNNNDQQQTGDDSSSSEKISWEDDPQYVPLEDIEIAGNININDILGSNNYTDNQINGISCNKVTGAKLYNQYYFEFLRENNDSFGSVGHVATDTQVSKDYRNNVDYLVYRLKLNNFRNGSDENSPSLAITKNIRFMICVKTLGENYPKFFTTFVIPPGATEKEVKIRIPLPTDTSNLYVDTYSFYSELKYPFTNLGYDYVVQLAKVKE